MALAGKVALITGAAQGLGKAFSEILLNNGAKVNLLDINTVTGKNTKLEFDRIYGAERTLFTSCDVTSETQLQEAFRTTMQTFGRLDVVCNNAGINNENKWEHSINVNLISVIRGTYLGFQYMSVERGGHGGVIINVASMAGLFPMSFGPVYSGSKHGVVGFSRSIAEITKLNNCGVRVNVLCPSITDTDILKTIASENNMGQFAHLANIAQKTMETVGILKPSLVAEGFLQLVTDTTKNGAVMRVTMNRGIDYHPYKQASL
ncbi:15-hydroxyprostaglandin dehydrogenase [NAD(+)]-like [Protopterus annectens]|uniref:15-hydroxyprostaglandin dehydrogenase [NAD(+)]-like n=1 Tax=Protopterus annectens TaxID=7888 RepID=UPI001CFA9121|nr:15-hydroxyprostaglandin dehydrogenase [NAD(+)]-like [Protopterus annectens]